MTSGNSGSLLIVHRNFPSVTVVNLDDKSTMRTDVSGRGDAAPAGSSDCSSGDETVQQFPSGS